MLLGLFMIRVLTAAPAKFTELQTIRGCLLVLGRDVVATLTVVTLKHNIIAWHNLNPIFVLCSLYFALCALYFVLCTLLFSTQC